MTGSDLEPFQATDGAWSSIEVFDDAGLPASSPIALIVPALGVSARFYRGLADPLIARSIRPAILELRGRGRSEVRPGGGVDFGLAVLVESDLRAAVALVAQRWPGPPILLIGHSLGGQLAALFCATHPGSVAAFVGVASTSVYWRAWPRGQRISLWIATQLPAILGRGLGSYPGHRLGFAGHEATSVMRDWARQSRTGDYHLTGTATDYESALARCTTPGLLLSLPGDWMAPACAVDHLAAKLPTATTVHLPAGSLHPDLARVHFDWVKAPDPILDRIDAWWPRST